MNIGHGILGTNYFVLHDKPERKYDIIFSHLGTKKKILLGYQNFFLYELRNVEKPTSFIKLKSHLTVKNPIFNNYIFKLQYSFKKNNCLVLVLLYGVSIWNFLYSILPVNNATNWNATPKLFWGKILLIPNSSIVQHFSSAIYTLL